MSNRILRRPEVEARCGLSRSTLYDWMKAGGRCQQIVLARGPEASSSLSASR